MTPGMQGVIKAVGKTRKIYDKYGPETAFFKVLPSPSVISRMTGSLHLVLHAPTVSVCFCVCLLVFGSLELLAPYIYQTSFPSSH